MERSVYIFDLDGVIYRGDTPQPFAADAISNLKSSGRFVFYLTNNASRTRQFVADKLSSMGIPTVREEVMTSSYGTVLWFRQHGALGKRVMIIGEEGCFDELAEGGMQVVHPEQSTDVDFVVVGIDRKFSYEKLAAAQEAILKGATFIATNRDATYPTEGGIMPGGGSIVASVATSVSKEPITIGKPQTFCIDKILEIAGVGVEQAVMVGDRLDTDIAVGNAAGVQTVFVEGGVNSLEEAMAAVGEEHADRMIPNLSLLLEATSLKRARE